LVERFVRALLIVLEAKAVEGTLLGFPGAGRRRCGGEFEGEMHPLVAAILLWLAGLDVLVTDTEFEPPGGELRETCRGLGGEGRAIVRADGIGEPKRLEERPQSGLDAFESRP